MSLTTETLAMRHEIDKLAVFLDLGYRPHPGQIAVHRSRAPRRVVACGVRWGKTLAAAMEAIVAALEPKERSIGWVCAPTYDLADKVFREIVAIVGTHLRHRLVSLKEGERRVMLVNLAGGRSEIRAKSADNPVSLLGEGLDFLIVDEAARLHRRIWEGHLSQRLIDKKGWALFISTPSGMNWLYDLYRRGQSEDQDYESWNAPSWQNPHLDAKLIEAERERLPERVFAQEFAGAFVEGSGQVFRNVHECATGELAEPVSRTRYYAGLDLARVVDYTVLVIIDRDRRVVFMDRFHRIDWSQQVDRIDTALGRYRSPEVYVDSTGAGEPIYEALRAAGISARSYPFTTRSKAALVDNLALLLERKEITLPRPELAPELIDELESFQYSVTDAGTVRSGAPGGGHDDCVCALALAAWALRPRREPRGSGLPIEVPMKS